MALADLNVPAGKSSVVAALAGCYSCVAVTHTVAGKLSPATVELIKASNAFAPVQLGPVERLRLKAAGRQLVQHSRITVILDEQKETHHLTPSSTLFHDFHLLAVQPTTDKLFAQCCEKLDVDIICLDLAERLPFYIKQAQVRQAIERGIFFEISYAAAIQDSTARRNLITNAISLVNATMGKNLLLSSRAERAMLVRGPYDVINLSKLFGLNQGLAKQALSQNCRAALAHGVMRRHTAKGVFHISRRTVTAVPGSDGGGVDAEDDGGAAQSMDVST